MVRVFSLSGCIPCNDVGRAGVGGAGRSEPPGKRRRSVRRAVYLVSGAAVCETGLATGGVTGTSAGGGATAATVGDPGTPAAHQSTARHRESRTDRTVTEPEHIQLGTVGWVRLYSWVLSAVYGCTTG